MSIKAVHPLIFAAGSTDFGEVYVTDWGVAPAAATPLFRRLRLGSPNCEE